jgi:predicted Na+-dependent transporter
MRLKLLFIMTTSQVCENGIVLVGVYVFLSIGLVFVIVLHISHPLVFPDITDSSIIINGAEKTLAAGGGLRALRHLKNLKK